MKICPFINAECLKNECELYDTSINLSNRCAIRTVAYVLRIFAKAMNEDTNAIRMTSIGACEDDELPFC